MQTRSLFLQQSELPKSPFWVLRAHAKQQKDSYNVPATECVVPATECAVCAECACYWMCLLLDVPATECVVPATECACY